MCNIILYRPVASSRDNRRRTNRKGQKEPYFTIHDRYTVYVIILYIIRSNLVHDLKLRVLHTVDLLICLTGSDRLITHSSVTPELTYTLWGGGTGEQCHRPPCTFGSCSTDRNSKMRCIIPAHVSALIDCVSELKRQAGL